MEQVSLDPNDLALTVLKYATSGNWRALAALGVLATVFAIRTWLLAPAALGRFAALAWFKTDKGGVALNFLVSVLGGAGNALAAHAALTKELLLTSMVNACIAAGVFVSIKRLMGKPAEHPAVLIPAAVPVPVAVNVEGLAQKPADDASITTTTTVESPK